MADTDPDRRPSRSDAALDPLEAEVERDRADLLSTVDALRRRLSPGGGRAGVGAVLGRAAREGAREGLMRRARENPLQAVALGAGVAYPAARIASKIPAPILLLGAGVALAGRGGSRGGLAEERPVEETRVAVVEEVAVAEPSGSAGGSAAAPRVSTPAAASASGSTVAASASGSTRPASGAAARARIAAAGRGGQETLIEAIQRHPGAAAGLGLVVGGALAAMLPRSRTENRLFGEAGEEARARARALAADGIESGRRVVAAAREEAEDQNLTPEDARRVAQDAGRRAREAAGDAAEDVSATASGNS